MAVPSGLEFNKTLMDQKFNSLTAETTGALYKAAYNAYKNLQQKSMDAADSNVEDEELSSLASTQKQTLNNKIEQDSKDFANDFCEGFSEMLKEISTQIDAHIKSMIINVLAVTPGPSGTVLASPVGPVTGTVSANNLSPTGGITIS